MNLLELFFFVAENSCTKTENVKLKDVKMLHITKENYYLIDSSLWGEYITQKRFIVHIKILISAALILSEHLTVRLYIYCNGTEKWIAIARNK